jgi:pyruvate formate lyase activating enzyme
MHPDGAAGLILHVQRLSTEDGPGIRSTVFFKGCPLACRWCHNPESLSGAPELQWFSARCIGCRSCLPACPRGCLLLGPGGLAIERGRCDGCGACARECPSNALELLGTRVSVAALVAELAKDRAYYDASGGGVSLSGGEPTAQSEFAAAVIAALAAAGIATAVDTCGFAAPESFDRLAQGADLLLFDLKTMDPATHRALTGQSNGPIMANLLRLAEKAARGERVPRLWIRTPLVPWATATAENLRAIGSFIAASLGSLVERWELCAFNNLCREQYRRLDVSWAYAETPLMSGAELDGLAAHARASGIAPGLLRVTGAARSEAREKEGKAS